MKERKEGMMMVDISANHRNNMPYRWTFFRAGGFDQVRLASGADLTALDQLDQKLWVALSCPTQGVEFDGRTLELIDGDKDGRIRVPEIIEAVKWAGSLLKNPDDLLRGSTELELSSINDQTPEGRQLLDSARHILASLGKPDASTISVTDTTDTATIFAQTKFNGDGIVPADSAEEEGIQQVIAEIIDCLGAEVDRSGKPGVSQAKVDLFFQDARAYSDWWKESEAESARIMPLGEATASAAEILKTVRAKVDDYFVRCRLVAFDERALTALSRQESEYAVLADRNFSSSAKEVAGFPLARIDAGGTLPLKEGLNPAWSIPMETFAAGVVKPLLGEKSVLTEEDWSRILSTFAPYEAWLSRKAGASVEKLGIKRVREILAGPARDAVTALIARDQALEPEFNAIASVEKLVRYHRDLFTLLNNFVSFSDFYTRRKKAIFQAGTLYLDGRSCDLCVVVDDVAKHAALATLSRTYLVYCTCVRKGGEEKMTIAAAFTGGDADYLMIGRNGVFYDRKRQDWDATIIRIIEHPISICQAFWSPYKRIGKMIGEQIEKLAASRDKAVTDKVGAGIAATGRKVEVTVSPAPAQPFDVAKFAGIFAAIGLAVGAIGTAIAAVVTGFLQLSWWKMPIAIAGLMLVVSGPSMVIAWLKLRQRTLGPILDANGWAVNARARINIPFGSSLTKVAVMPEGAVRSLEDPYADRKSPWPKIIVLLVILLLALYFFFDSKCLLREWLSAILK